MGIYKFNTTDNPKTELVYRPEAGPIGANGGATLVDAKYFYCITYTKLSGTTISNELICYDIESWTEVSRKAIPLTTISHRYDLESGRPKSVRSLLQHD